MLNIAHRGFTKEFPDNTLEAFEAAIDLGVDAIECDVQETSDSRFVIFHEPELHGIEVSKLSAAQVRRIRLREKFKIPTLEEVIGLCRGRVGLIFDLKVMRSVDRFLRLIRASVEADKVGFSSTDLDLVLRLSHQASEFRRGIILDSPLEDPGKMAEASGCDVIGVPWPYATEELVERLHGNNYLIFVWGCRDPEEIKKALGLEIDGIVSDFPDVVRQELTQRRGGA